MICGEINHPLRPAGVIMKSSCSFHSHQSTNDCQTVHRWNMTLRKELPVFDSTQNVTYRSIACARCNSEGNLSYWGLDISCVSSSWLFVSLVNITAIKRFLNEHPDCSWKYAQLRNLKKYHKSCVLHDTQCASNQLPMMSLVKELCYSYSMVFSVVVNRTILTYRNPHCALCNPEGKSGPLLPSPEGGLPPWSILLDVSSDILHPNERENSQPALNSVSATQEVTSQLFNCTSTINNCTVNFGGQMCEVFTSTKNLSTQMPSSLNKSRVLPSLAICSLKWSVTHTFSQRIAFVNDYLRFAKK